MPEPEASRHGQSDSPCRLGGLHKRLPPGTEYAYGDTDDGSFHFQAKSVVDYYRTLLDGSKRGANGLSGNRCRSAL